MRPIRLSWLLTAVLGALATVAPLTGCAARGGHSATSNQSFSDVEHWAETWNDPGRKEWQKPREVVRTLGIRAGDRVAELGAGTGYMTFWIAASADEAGVVYAVDIEPALLAHLAQRTDFVFRNVELVLAEPDDPKLPDSELDLVVSVNTWHHIDDRLEYLPRLERSLNSGGRVAVIDWRAGELPEGPPPKHKLSREEVIEEFEEAGWSFVAESTLLPFQYFLVFYPPPADVS